MLKPHWKCLCFLTAFQDYSTSLLQERIHSQLNYEYEGLVGLAVQTVFAACCDPKRFTKTKDKSNFEDIIIIVFLIGLRRKMKCCF